jgi:hypothetical protein
MPEAQVIAIYLREQDKTTRKNGPDKKEGDDDIPF